MDSMAERARMIKEWRMWVSKIAEAVKELLPDAEVYVVGSVVRGDFIAASDVDVVVVSKSAPRKPIEIARLKATVEEKLNLPYYHPFEIHVLSLEEAKYFLEKSKGCVLRIA